jgi:hypothetical protein
MCAYARRSFSNHPPNSESTAFNDRTWTSGDYLEKPLDFYFKL